MIDLGDGPVTVAIVRHPRARHVLLRADVISGEVRVTVPSGLAMTTALRHVRANRDWLIERFARASGPVSLTPGARFAYLGRPVVIAWSAEHSRTVRYSDGMLRVGGASESVPRRITAWLKAMARDAMLEDLTDYCRRARVGPPGLSIGDARSRWGSCSRRRDKNATIRMNWRLIMAPPMVRRSVVAHEVAHLVHMNHGADFYALLGDLYEGDIGGADDWLRQHGPALHMIGRDQGAAATAPVVRSGTPL